MRGRSESHDGQKARHPQGSASDCHEARHEWNNKAASNCRRQRHHIAIVHLFNQACLKVRGKGAAFNTAANARVAAYSHLSSCGDWLACRDSAANWLGLRAGEGANASGPKAPKDPYAC